MRSILTEIDLCHACSCHEISGAETAGQEAWAAARTFEEHVVVLLQAAVSESLPPTGIYRVSAPFPSWNRVHTD